MFFKKKVKVQLLNKDNAHLGYKTLAVLYSSVGEETVLYNNKIHVVRQDNGNKYIRVGGQ